MITTKITITPYLAEYLIAKYNNWSESPITIPDNTDLYHLLWQLMARRPIEASAIDQGNLVINLPKRRLGKDPMYFNYLSPHSCTIIQRMVKRMFDLELHEVMTANIRNGRPYRDIDVVYRFMQDYGLESISEDALIKNYYRYKDGLRKKRVRQKQTRNVYES